MSNKEIQRVRMTKYFIDAALDVIHREGVDQLSARKVADVAGYSYATLYNYFEDMNELSWQVVSVMTHEIVEYLKSIEMDGLTGKERLSKLNYAYADYYLKNPRIFEFLFLHKIGEIPKKVKVNLRSSLVRDITSASVQVCVDEGSVDESMKREVTNTLESCVHGTLMLFFSKKVHITTSDLYKRFDSMLDLVVR